MRTVDIFKYNMIEIPKPKLKRKPAVVVKADVDVSVAKLLAEITKKRN